MNDGNGNNHLMTQTEQRWLLRITLTKRLSLLKMIIILLEFLAGNCVQRPVVGRVLWRQERPWCTETNKQGLSISNLVLISLGYAQECSRAHTTLSSLTQNSAMPLPRNPFSFHLSWHTQGMSALDQFFLLWEGGGPLSQWLQGTNWEEWEDSAGLLSFIRVVWGLLHVLSFWRKVQVASTYPIKNIETLSINFSNVPMLSCI